MNGTSQLIDHDVMSAATSRRYAAVRPDEAESLADIIESLFLVFEQRLGLITVLAVVQACCHEVDIDAEPGAASRIGRLARARLLELAAECPTPAPPRDPAGLGLRRMGSYPIHGRLVQGSAV